MRNKNADVVVSDKASAQKLIDLEKGLELTPEKVANNPRFKVLSGAAVENIPEYRVGPGDVLEVVYHIQYDRVDEPYKLQVLDRINVNFAFQPQFNSSAVVRSDGKISLPLVGDVMVESLTPTKVAEDLNRVYAKYILKPNITVSLEESNVKVEELKKAITTAPRGQSKITPVAPDGRVGFPIVGTLQAGGLTVSQIEVLLNEKYKASVPNLQVNVILNEIHYSKCFIAGEVERPGVYEMPGREPLLAVLARAGSTKTTADIGEVVIFRNEGLERPIAIKVDLSQTADKALAATNIYVHPADIIFVPKGTIDNMNDFINKVFTKGIYSILPFSSSFTANYDLKNTYTIK
jgi:polysaccharide biosynthesis/export protein